MTPRTAQVLLLGAILADAPGSASARGGIGSIGGNREPCDATI